MGVQKRDLRNKLADHYCARLWSEIPVRQVVLLLPNRKGQESTGIGSFLGPLTVLADKTSTCISRMSVPFEDHRYPTPLGQAQTQ